MLFDFIGAIRTGNMEELKWAFASLLLCLPIVILALSVHETAHGYVAYKLGDPTARNMGRLTLNPLKHLDPIGFLCMVAFGFGWAKPVPINTRYFKKPKRDMAISALAGPVSNLLMAVLFAGLLKLFTLIPLSVSLSSQLMANVMQFAYILLYLGIQLNVALAVFNLIPIPPLDGSKLLYVFLPSRIYHKFLQYEQYISIALLLLLALGVITPILSFITNAIMNLLFIVFFI